MNENQIYGGENIGPGCRTSFLKLEFAQDRCVCEVNGLMMSFGISKEARGAEVMAVVCSHLCGLQEMISSQPLPCSL